MNLLSFEDYYQQKQKLIESYLLESFPCLPGEVRILEESMRYSLLAGGKRLRPVLLLTTIESTGLEAEFALPFATALEYIHSYSLIHDDLPCMDDDDLRRGQPANHIQFGDNIALLAGDALLTYSFSLMSSRQVRKNLKPELILEAINFLAFSSGVFGMVGGQTADIIPPDNCRELELLDFIHTNKTGALITASIYLGAILAQVSTTDLEQLVSFGKEIGKSFQIQDDILDETGHQDLLGKIPGSDKKNKKLTYPSLYGLEKSVQLAEESYQKALGFLTQTSLNTQRLQELASFMVKRQN